MTGAAEWCQSLHRDPLSVNCVQFTADAKRIIAGTANGNISVCIVHTGNRRAGICIIPSAFDVPVLFCQQTYDGLY